MRNGEDYLEGDEVIDDDEEGEETRQPYDDSMMHVAPQFSDRNFEEMDNSSQLLRKFTSQRLTIEDLGPDTTAMMNPQSSARQAVSRRQLMKENQMLLERIQN